jgi:hypothetical protein
MSTAGRRLVGSDTTGSSLARFERTGEPFAAPEDPDQVGNGSLMRIAPRLTAHRLSAIEPPR